MVVKSSHNHHQRNFEALRDELSEAKRGASSRATQFHQTRQKGDVVQQEQSVPDPEPLLRGAPRHPVLEYQRNTTRGIWPASYKDPILIPSVAGPVETETGLYGEPSMVRKAVHPYQQGQGPVIGKPQGIPVPMGSLKQTNERYNPDMFRYPPGTNTVGGAPSLPLGSDFPPIGRGSNPSSDYFRPYGPNSPNSFGNLPFYGNVDAYAPFQEIVSPWEKAGILVSMRKGSSSECKGEECKRHGENELLNLFRRGIAPVQDVWEYMVQDKDGFVIKLENRRYINDGDVVDHVIGKGGPYRAHMFVQNKYIYV